MSVVTVNDPHRERRITYWVLGIIFLLMAGTGVAIFHTNKESDESLDKAAQLSAALASAGIRAPSTNQIVGVLGNDGGAVCADPASALNKGILYGQLTNGAAGPGQRPVIADNNVLHGQLLIMKIYCPDQLAKLQEIADDLKLADVA
ncbi:hypothetical protein [Paractinoplanes toevensis]|uniref:Uncharacterized protein n=1 Tax=Paractinoplanes toevensis TaxID=571911 RepID=A0A920BNM5_9ACTN|nr:hypothetical protein [Actinoplanes toevensis]GIM95952.1 hypothetical protein Ato02nite_077450 [Actinoplanes toevensis]